jgi:hypothetical protein
MAKSVRQTNGACTRWNIGTNVEGSRDLNGFIGVIIPNKFGMTNYAEHI